MIEPDYQNAIVRRVQQIVKLLAEKEYEALARASKGIRISADEIRGAIEAYDGHIVMPPQVTYALCDVIEIELPGPRQWSVNFDLWTEEEGRSDLTLELTVVENGMAELDFEIDGIHVL